MSVSDIICYVLYRGAGVLSMVIVVDLLCLFFFFKQKTAYEMCGRDWSSDVCSSDLSGQLRSN